MKKNNLRMIIPINDKVYSDVKSCIEIFFNNLEKTIKEYGVDVYEYSVIMMLRKMICQINDKTSKEPVFTNEQITAIERSADLEYMKLEKELILYFNDISNFDTFKNKYPDLLEDLYEVYNKNEHENNERSNRSNYVKKHIELSFEDFQKIIFKDPYGKIINAFNYFNGAVDENINNKLLERLIDEGTIDQNLEKEKIAAMMVLSLSLDTEKQNIFKYAGAGAGAVAAAGSIAVTVIGNSFAFMIGGGLSIPIIGLILGGAIGSVFSYSDYLGLWKKRNTREDITKGLIKWLEENKTKIIDRFLEKFKEFQQLMIDKIKGYRVLEKSFKDLLLEIDKYKKRPDFDNTTDNRKEFLSLLTNQKLKDFFNKVFEYKEEEDDEEEEEE